MTYAVNLNDTHIVTVDPEEEHGECRCVHNAQTVGLAGLEWECRILVETDSSGGGVGIRARNGSEICPVLREVDQRRVCGNPISIALLAQGQEDIPGTGSAPPGLATLMNCLSKVACSS